MSSSAVSEPVAVRTPPRREVSSDPETDDRPAASGRFAIRLPRDAWPFLLLMAVGFALRVWVLGDRAEHHDESMHALFSYDLYTGKGFRHDPILHGTFLFIQNALVYWLFGASDFTSRLAPVLHGVAVIGMPYFLRQRRYLGQTGAVVASAFLCLSPCFLYYSRFIREDIFAASLQFGAAICLLRYLDERKPKYLYIMAAALAFSFNDKENTYMTAAIFAAFAFLWCWRAVPALLIRGGSAPAAQNHGALDVFVVLCTLVAPLGTAMMVAVEKALKLPTGTTNNDQVLAVVLALLFAASAVVGLRWRASVWTTCAVIFWGIFAVMFTTLFTNPVGFWTGIIESLRYWLAQQDVHRGEQPQHYYVVLLSLYEYLPIALAAFGAWIAVRDWNRFALFCLFWAATAFGFYTWAAEKMPWLSLHMALPIILLGSFALGRFLEGVDWRDLWRQRALMLGGLILVGFAVLAGISKLNGDGFQLTEFARPLEGQRRALWYAGMAVVFVGVVIYGVNAASALGLRRTAQTVALTLLAVASLFYVRASFMATYQFGDIPREILIYTQSSPDVTAVMREINRLNHRTGQGTNFKVAYDSGVSWPFEWYLRNQKGRVFYGDGLPPKDAGVVLVSFENYGSSGITREEAARQALGSDYVGTRYRLRWWFPEKYRQVGVSNLIPTLMNEQNRAELWRFLLYREIEPLDSTDFMMYVRKDLVGDLGTGVTPTSSGSTTAPPSAAQPAAPQAPAAPAVEAPTKVQAVQTIGSAGAGDGQLTDPKGVAVAPDGSLWVADTGNSRIVKFGPDGTFQLKVGSKGAGQGQFNEPWGIAVGPDGNVYVADTWNHRIVKLGPDGTWIKAWGEVIDTRGLALGAENGFYGPRSIAFMPDGSLLITDAGNKRIVRDSPDGQYLSQFGGRGAEPGKFEEQVGIATDRDGNVYVADTWNKRIQKFSPDFQPVAQWPVSGWRSQGVPHKPYIAVDAQGRVYITDPENSRVQAYSPEGQVIQTWGGIGRDLTSLTLPTGIAVDGQGRVWIADAGNNRLVAFPPVGQGPRG